MSGWVAGAVIGGAVISASASNKAAKVQSQSADKSLAVNKQISDDQIALQKRQYEDQKALERDQFEYQKALQAPFQQAGVNALSRMQAGEFAQPGAFKFGANDYQADPGYAFRLAEGQKALDRQAAARGGLISGGALKAATRYGQEMGSQEYQNAYNRALTGYNTDVARSDTGYNRLASLAGVGQVSTDKIGAAGQAMTSGIGSAGQNMTSGVNTALSNYGNAATDAYTGSANARSSGYVGTANAINQGLGTYLNYNQSQNMLNAMNARNIPGFNYSPGVGGYNYTYQNPTSVGPFQQ
jgi:hypothetical protein